MLSGELTDFLPFFAKETRRRVKTKYTNTKPVRIYVTKHVDAREPSPIPSKGRFGEGGMTIGAFCQDIRLSIILSFSPLLVLTFPICMCMKVRP